MTCNISEVLLDHIIDRGKLVWQKHIVECGKFEEMKLCKILDLNVNVTVESKFWPIMTVKVW